jgi:L-asparaginase/Glu-tRNA(Gln) amidotransferase subunit D
MAIQLEKPGTISVLDSGGTILSGPSPATTLSTPTVYKELSLEELKIMRDGLTEMIQMIEKN